MIFSEDEMEEVAGLEFREKVVSINRVAKVVKGGKRFSFSVIVVVGDGNGNVGFSVGKANEIPDAIRKAVERAKKQIIKVPLINGTIPHEVIGEYGASKVILKPAKSGTGIIAGGAIRAVMELAGVNNILTKSLRSNNPHNVLKATMKALSELQTPEEHKKKRELLSPEEGR